LQGKETASGKETKGTVSERDSVEWGQATKTFCGHRSAAEELGIHRRLFVSNLAQTLSEPTR